MNATVDRSPVTAALVAMLIDATDRPWGDGEAPADTSVPYGVVWELAGGAFEGPAFSAPDADAALPYGLTCVGERRDQAGALADRARRAMLGRSAAGVLVVSMTSQALTDAGLVVEDRQALAISGIDREGRVFNATDQYLVIVRQVVA